MKIFSYMIMKVLYIIMNMISETYINELNENISIYDLISFLGTTNNNDNKLHLIMAKYK